MRQKLASYTAPGVKTLWGWQRIDPLSTIKLEQRELGENSVSEALVSKAGEHAFSSQAAQTNSRNGRTSPRPRIPALGRQRQVGLYSPLAILSSPTGELQANKRPYFRRR